MRYHHADRHAASAVRDSGTGNVAKAEALVEATGGIFGPHAEIKAKPAASGLADQRAHELLANALAARIRFHADRHLRGLFVAVGDLKLFGGKAPCPGGTDDFAVRITRSGIGPVRYSPTFARFRRFRGQDRAFERL